MQRLQPRHITHEQRNVQTRGLLGNPKAVRSLPCDEYELAMHSRADSKPEYNEYMDRIANEDRVGFEHNRYKPNIAQHVDLSLVNGFVSTRGIAYDIDNMRHNKQSNTLVASIGLESGKLRIHRDSIMGGDLSELYVSFSNILQSYFNEGPMYQIKMLPINTFGTPYLVYVPEFKYFAFHNRINMQQTILNISDSAGPLKLRQVEYRGSVVNGVVDTDEVTGLVTGDFIRIANNQRLMQNYAVTVVTPMQFTIMESFTGDVTFIVNKYNFGYSIKIHTEGI